jgi:hypothetical protein
VVQLDVEDLHSLLGGLEVEALGVLKEAREEITPGEVREEGGGGRREEG